MRRFITNRKTPASASNSWRKLSDTSAQSSKLRTPVRGVRGRVRRRILRTFPYAILYQTIAVTPIRDLHIADASALSLFDSEHSNARLILPIYLGNGTGTVGAVCSQLGQTYWGEIVNDILKMLRALNPLNPYAWSESARLIGQQQ